MKEKGKNIGLLLAVGKGERVHCARPKQFVAVGGRTVLGHTLAVFAATPGIDLIYTVCAPEWTGLAAEIGRKTCGRRFAGTVDGGETGIASLRRGVEARAAAGRTPFDVVLVHDAVRPLVSPEIIADCIRVCREKGNAVASAASRETFLCTDGQRPARTVWRRDTLHLAQTPVGFRLGTLQEIFASADEQGIAASESLVTLCDALSLLPLHPSAGHWTNFKITEDADLAIFRQLLQGRSR